jgi:hypothetical protein
MAKTKAVMGVHNMTCDRSGKVYPSNEMKKEWTGAWVHKSKWEPKHPQLMIKSRKEKIAVEPARPEDALDFIPYTPVPMPGSDLDEY